MNTLYTILDNLKLAGISLLFIFASFESRACSMYKLSKDGRTVVGCNEDAWRSTPHIWFEKGTSNSFGCCFTGSRKIGENKFAAQSGMNEKGLVFTRLASYHPVQTIEGQKLLIEHPDQFLMDLLKNCASIDAVYNTLKRYDRTCYLQDVFIYIEPSGKYLIVEPYQLIKGTDSTFVQANFCPSITPEKDRLKQERYRKGKLFLSQYYSTDTAFCRKLSSEMHVCRDKVGDGTLLTSIWNPHELKVRLYFYHNYSEFVDFDLSSELKKGNHQLPISELFHRNQEFEKLKSYITPFNTDWIRFVLAGLGFTFILSAMYLIVSTFRKQSIKSRMYKVLFSLLLTICFSYLFILATNIGVYYYPSPYVHPTSYIIYLISFTPYLIVLAVISYFLLIRNQLQQLQWTSLTRKILLFNVYSIALLLAPILYWGLMPYLN